MSRFLLYLRVAFSVFCGVACVLLIVLWVRSYWRVDNLYIPVWSGRVLNVSSGLGQLAISTEPWYGPRNRQFISQPAAPNRVSRTERGYVNPTLRFTRFPAQLISTLFMRIWIPVLAAGFLAAIPWIHWSKRFSLRTLLITITIFALILGLIVATTR